MGAERCDYNLRGSISCRNIKETNMSLKQKDKVNPNVIQDSSAETSGLIANAIAAEEESLFTEDNLYGAADQVPEPEFKVDKNFTYVISGILMASYLSALDATVVSTLLTVIASDLNAISNISWIATAYLLSCAAFQPLFGKISDIFGRKPIFLACIVVFAFGCTICVTDSLVVLVVGRFVTGIGGSGLNALGTITMSDIIPLRERGLYQGIANVCFGLGAASGGIIGGLVADTLGWKYVFILQVPISVLVFLTILFKLNLPEGSPGLGMQGSNMITKLKRVDFLGSFFLVSGLIFIMTAASFGGTYIPFSSYTFVSLCFLALIQLLGFGYVESSVAKEPILPVEVMLERTVLASSLTNWFSTMATLTNLFYVPLYFSTVMNLTATENGLRLLPNFFCLSVGSVTAGYYMKKTGRYYKFNVIIGILSIIGMLNVLFVSATSNLFRQYTLIILTGYSYSAMLTVTLLSLIAAVPLKYQACTTSIQYTFRSTGSTLGLCIASAIFQNVLRPTLTKNVNEAVADPKEAAKVISKALENTKYISEAPEYLRHILRMAYSTACKYVFAFSLIMTILAFTSSLFMKEHILHTTMNRD